MYAVVYFTVWESEDKHLKVVKFYDNIGHLSLYAWADRDTVPLGFYQAGRVLSPKEETFPTTGMFSIPVTIDHPFIRKYEPTD